MIKTKEDFINNIIEKLDFILDREKILKIKDILILEMKNIKVEEIETSLVVTENENASFVRKFIAVKKLKRMYWKNIKILFDRTC